MSVCIRDNSTLYFYSLWSYRIGLSSFLNNFQAWWHYWEKKKSSLMNICLRDAAEELSMGYFKTWCIPCLQLLSYALVITKWQFVWDNQFCWACSPYWGNAVSYTTLFIYKERGARMLFNFSCLIDVRPT